AIQRSWSAPSDQSGTTTSYGTRPEAGRVASAGSTHPVCESKPGGPPPGPPDATSLEIWPPDRSATYSSPSAPSPNDEMFAPCAICTGVYGPPTGTAQIRPEPKSPYRYRPTS